MMSSPFVSGSTGSAGGAHGGNTPSSRSSRSFSETPSTDLRIQSNGVQVVVNDIH